MARFKIQVAVARDLRNVKTKSLQGGQNCNDNVATCSSPQRYQKGTLERKSIFKNFSKGIKDQKQPFGVVFWKVTAPIYYKKNLKD